MKKIFVAVCVLVFASMTVFAVDVSLGFRGGLNLNLGTTPEGDFKKGVDFIKSTNPNVKNKIVPGGEFGVYLNLGISDVGACVFGMSFGVDVAFRNGYAVKIGENYWEGFLSNAVDVPLLITCNIPIADFMRLGIGAGGFASVPFGLHNEVVSNSSHRKGNAVPIATSIFTAGLLFDVNYGFKVGRGYILLDVRYLLDLMKTKGKVGIAGALYEDEVFTRRDLTIGLGYEILF